MTDLLTRQLAAFDRGAGIRVEERTVPSPLDVLTRLQPRAKRPPALEMVSAAVERTLRVPDSRLIVVLPPQLGKSTVATRAGTLHALMADPTRRVVIASYADRIAHRFGRMIRNDIASNQGRSGGWDCGLRIAADQKAKHEWELTSGGGVYSVGVGGSLTSRSADVLLIDDPLRGRKDADSPIIRDDLWDWWESTAASRLQPGAPVILILTRWHYDDLAGRLMREQPGKWELLHIPAQADPEIVDPDPLGRAPGEYLESAQGWTVDQWEERRRDAGDEWTPLHQGAPAAPGGELFDTSRLRFWHWNTARDELVCGVRSWRLWADCWRFVTVDLAFSTKRTADWTVASCWAIPADGTLVLLDVARARVPEHQQIDVARPLVERWRPEATYVEASSRSTQLVREAVQAGWQIRDLVADKDKVTRAAGAARRVHHGLVWWPASAEGLLAGPEMLDVAMEELRQFPAGRNDDFVDTLAYADRVRWQDYIPPATLRDPVSSEVGALVGAVDVPAGFDPMRADW